MPSGYVGIAEMMPQGGFEISKHLPRQEKNLAVSHTSRLIQLIDEGYSSAVAMCMQK